jgi:hypothetical protein
MRREKLVESYVEQYHNVRLDMVMACRYKVDRKIREIVKRRLEERARST